MSIRTEVRGRISLLLIDRAAKRNAFTQEMWEAFPAALDRLLGDDGVRAIVLAAAEGGTFCAGADIAEFAIGARDAAWRAKNQAAIAEVQIRLARAEKPVIAAVEGDCVGGGCGLANACDMRVAGPKARFGITPAKLGLVYSLHDTKLLVDLVGPSAAKRILFTGQLLPAAEAHRIGLVDVLADDPLAQAMELAETIASVSSHSVREAKKMVRRILDGQPDDDEVTSALFAAAFTGPDFAEGVEAFLAKRPAKFP